MYGEMKNNNNVSIIILMASMWQQRNVNGVMAMSIINIKLGVI
jgi:hypothetical protein